MTDVESTIKTRVFASWSGEPSKAIAQDLAWFIQKLLQATEVWFSPESIELGEPWPQKIAQALSEAKYGFAVITQGNRDSLWVSYEAGAIASKLQASSKFVPLLFGLSLAELGETPLKYLQAAEWSETAAWRLVSEINKLLGPMQRGEQTLREDFDEAWPKLRSKLESHIAAQPKPRRKTPTESLDAKVQRIENLVRDMHARLVSRDGSTSAATDLTTWQQWLSTHPSPSTVVNFEDALRRALEKRLREYRDGDGPNYEADRDKDDE
jgi:hypothetical protein